MSYAVGVALFALAIGLSIALHEFGHLLFGGVSLLTILADVVNPIDNPFAEAGWCAGSAVVAGAA